MRKLAFGLLWLVVLWVPLENTVLIDGFGTATRLLGVCALATAVLAIVLEGKLRRLVGTHYCMALFVFIAAASLSWTLDAELTLPRVTTYAQLLAFVWLIWELAKTRWHQHQLLQSYVVGAALAACYTLYNFALSRTLQGSYTARYAASGFDPNDLALILAIGIPAAWYLGNVASGTVSPWLFRSYTLLSVLAILLTGSRGSALAAAVALCYIIWTIPRLSHVAKLVGLLVGFAGLFFVLQFVPEDTWMRLSTIGDELRGGNFNFRTVIWGEAWTTFLGRPILGVGAGAFRAFGDPLLVAHNAFLSVLVEGGIFGFLAFVAIMGTLLNRLRFLSSEDRVFWLFMFATWVCGVLALSWEYRKPTWLLLGLLTAVVWASEQPREDGRS